MTASEKLDVLNKWLFLKFPDRKKMGLVLGFKYFKDVKKHVVTIAPCDESIEWMFKVGNAEERRLADTEDEALEAWIREGEDLFGLQAPSFEGMLMELAVAGVEEKEKMKARSLDEKMLLLGKYLRWKKSEVFSNTRQNDKLVFVETDEHKFFITWTCLVSSVQHAADKGGFLSAYPTKEEAFDAFFESCRSKVLHEEDLSIEGIELKLEVAGLI